MSVRWMPVMPVPVIGAIVGVMLLLLAHGSLDLLRKRLPLGLVLRLGALRMAILAIFSLCLLQPVLSLIRTTNLAPPLLVLLDASRSMGLSDAGSSLNRLSSTLAAMEKCGLLEAIKSRENVHWFAFDSRARAIEPPPAESPDPTGATTHYGESLAGALELCRRQQMDNLPVVPGGRVLLVTDGHDFGARDVAAVARELALTIDTAAPPEIATHEAGPSVIITGIQAPRRVLLGAESRFSVALQQIGVGNIPLVLELKEGEKTIVQKRFAFRNSGEEKSVILAFRPEEAGLREYTVSVFAPGTDGNGKKVSEGGETKPSVADPRGFSVQVVGRRNEVLFLEDAWRWDFKFLRRIFEDDPSFTLTAFLARGQNAFVQLTEPERRTEVSGFPQTRSELGGFDTFVLGSVDPRRWPRSFSESLRSLVEEEGKSLIVIAGTHLREMSQHSTVADLLPVELSSESFIPSPGPIASRVTPEGLASSFFGAEETAYTALWNTLPAVDSLFPPLRKKPAATVLVEAESLHNSYGHLILAAEHTVGRGRVLFIGSDTLWKWHMQATNTEGPTPYQVFWQQTLRTLAPVRQTSGNAALFLTPEKSRYTTGQTVVIRSEAWVERESRQQRVQGQVTLPDGKQLPLDFRPDHTARGLFAARFGAELLGHHKISATLFLGDKPAAETLIGLDVDGYGGETNSTPPDRARLARIARDTGGGQIIWDQPISWKHLSAPEKIPASYSVTVDLWNRFILFGVLVLLLGTDWILRLRQHAADL